MSSDAQTWQKIFNHEITIKKALSSKKFSLDGPTLKALSNKSGLEKSVALMIDMKNRLDNLPKFIFYRIGLVVKKCFSMFGKYKKVKYKNRNPKVIQLTLPFF